jgi:hypothetical protein
VAFEVDDLPAVASLLGVFDGHPVGHVAPLLRAERDLARARLAAARGEADADGRLSAAVERVRGTGCGYNLAHALLDLAAHRGPSGGSVDELIAEAETIAAELGCAPLAERAAGLRTVRTY